MASLHDPITTKKHDVILSNTRRLSVLPTDDGLLVETFDTEQGACIITSENIHSEDDCTTHDHEPVVDKGQNGAYLLHWEALYEVTKGKHE